MRDSTFAPVRDAFRAVAGTIVPEAQSLDERAWTELESAIDTGLQTRPDSMRRQLRIFVRAIDVLPLFRFAKRFRALDPAQRTQFLLALQDSSLLLIRRGFWGLRTLVFMGYYGREEAQRAIGYRADPRGWEARR